MLDHWPAPLRRMVFALLGVNWSERLLQQAWEAGEGDLHAMLAYLFQRNRFDLSVDGAERLAQWPGCIVAGNHPHGLFDGLALAWLASAEGHPTRVMARNFLQVFQPLRSVFLSVTLDNQRRARSGAALQAATQWLQNDQRLVITPAAGLSRAKPFWASAEDPPWRSGVVRLAQATGRPIVLVKVEMPASPLRQLLHRIHPIVRALAQVWAYRLGRKQRIRLRIQAVIQPDALPGHLSLTEQTAWLQQQLSDSP
ncbi:MAG: 1-acyl-sn-glycerol-3-phosphate acyltransferase [Saccharospirillum sp.]